MSETLTRLGRAIPLATFPRQVRGDFDRRDLERGNLALRLDRLTTLARRRYNRRRHASNTAMGTLCVCRHAGPRATWQGRYERARTLEVEAVRLYRALAVAVERVREGVA